MIKTLRKQGNGQALPIEKNLMEAMGVDLDTPLEVTLTGNTLVVTPVHVGLPKEKICTYCWTGQCPKKCCSKPKIDIKEIKPKESSAVEV